MKKTYLYLVLALASLIPAKTNGETPETAFAELMVLSYIRGSVPLSFVEHGVVYENIGAFDPAEPFFYKCALVGVARTPYNRHAVIPYKITIGTYGMIVKEMRLGCFQQTGIKSIEIRAHLQSIPQNAFLFCEELETVSFYGNTPHFVSKAAFKGCTKLREIAFPAQLKYIGEQAFDQCVSLKEIYIPKDVEQIGPFAFQNCTSLSKLTFATGHFRIIPQHCFYNCGQLQEVEIPQGVSELGESCFAYSGLKTIVLPATMQVIRHDAFKNTPLVDIICKALTPPKTEGNWSLADLKKYRLHVPPAALEAYRTDPFWSHLTYIEPY